jgi:L-methionine (R)-S-oxide reductase
MAETLVLTKGAVRADIYRELTPQIDALVAGESDAIANLANIAAALKEALGFFWIGFYRVDGDELVLGPFQGPLACTRIRNGEGVCGQAWARKETVIVPDVDEFPGHIACSSASRSEIVIPIFDRDGSIWGVLDVDSDKVDDFGSVDAKGLSEIARMIIRFL